MKVMESREGKGRRQVGDGVVTVYICLMNGLKKEQLESTNMRE